MLESPVTVRPAAPADAEFVFRLTEACMRHYAEETWGQWNEEITRASFLPATHHIIQVDGRDIGCIALEQAADHLVLQKLYILPDWQNRGIGARIMRDIMAEAGARPLRVAVLVVNPARGFYQRLGFVVTRSTPERHYMEWRHDR